MLTLILGGTGFIGAALCRELLAAGHEVAVISRSPARAEKAFGGRVRGLAWDGRGPGEWVALLGPDTALVNLAGENIAARWTERKMARILSSRVDAGRAVADAVRNAPQKPACLVQASAVGYYGPRPATEIVDESTASGQGFLARVCREWEDSSRAVEDLGVPRAVIRTGVVLGPGGALARMVSPFRWFAGGPLGSGKQVLSWIHLADEVGAIRHILEHRLSGAFNLTAPQPTDNASFSKALGRVLHRPSLLPVPGFALRLLYGRMADEALLSGQYAVPRALLDAGYAFRFDALDAALADAVAGLLGNRA